MFVIQRELKSKLPYEIVNRKLLDDSNYLTFSCGFTITQSKGSLTNAGFVASQNLEKVYKDTARLT